MSVPQRPGSPARLEATLSGAVQGVNFRWFTQRQARDLGLVGYVRNRSDGTVDVVAEGSHERLQELLRRLKRGPSLAQVADVVCTWDEPRGEFRKFLVTG